MIRVRVPNSAMVGLVLLDSALKSVYSNSEARRILAYPNQPPKAPGAQFSESIGSIIQKKPDSSDCPMTTHFISGKRRYLCRVFVLEPESNGNSKAVIAITLERPHSVLSDLAVRFQLTDREVEAVQHLSEGLTSKEIAQRMKISPNTVKVFLRLVMVKMGVTTRSGVIGKLITGAGGMSTNTDTMR